ncbi:MAG: hypothetical protein LBP59_15745 [Planctomycetaceae bacterium]|jgi:hypothetical protein|nr:hypothetical protein [Planctomycetaceae bacterium]
MLKKLIERIDAIGDYINPVVVREMRRYATAAEVIINVYFGAAVFLSIICILASVLPDKGLQRDEFPVTAFLCGAGILLCFSGLIGLFSSVFSLDIHNLNPKSDNFDELFFAVPLSPLQRLNSYLGLMTLWLVFFISLSIPPFVIVYIVHGKIEIFFIPVISFFISIVAGLIAISADSQIRIAGSVQVKTFEKICYGFICLLMFFSVVAPWGVIIFLWHTILSLPSFAVIFSKFFSFNCYLNGYLNGFGCISIYILIPLILFANGITAYKFCRNGFNTGFKTNWKAMLRNNFAYFILNTICATIYLAIAIIYFTLIPP